MRKLVVLDGYCVNPGDFSFDVLNEFFDKVEIYDRTEICEVLGRIKDAECVLTCKVPILAEVINKCENLRYIGSMATGFNHIDIEQCEKNNIIVTNVPNYSTNAVSELVFAFIMEVYKNISHYNKRVHDGDWIKSKDFCFYDSNVSELYNKTIGVIGYGNIGKKVCKIAEAFDMNVLVYTRTKRENYGNVKFVSKEDLFKNSDIISLHCPLTDTNKELINTYSLKLMKNRVVIINTSRGGLVNENDLKEAIDSSKVYYACLDVVSVEPMQEQNPLYKSKNCIITPHYAWSPIETRKRLFDVVVDNIKAYRSNTPINVI